MMRTLSLSLLVAVSIASHPLHALTRTWTGSAGGNWSDVSNWSPSGTPAVADSLQFPAGASNTAMTNDLPAGRSFGPMTFNASGYSVSGNAMTLTGDVSYGAGVAVTWNSDLTIGTSLRMGDPSSAGGTFNGAIDVNGRTLLLLGGTTTLNGPLNGSGILNGTEISIGAGGNFNGAINSTLEVRGSLPNANVIGGLSGDGTVGTANVPSACFPLCQLSPGAAPFAHVAGALSTKSLRMDGTQDVDLFPAATSDIVRVTGTVTVSGRLNVTIPSGTPVPGQTFTIIDNDGSDAVSGTFFHLFERSMITVNGFPFRLSYIGGDGNDVVLTAVASTTTAVGQSAATTKYGQPVTFTASVASAAGTPTGSITFVVDGTDGGSAPLQNGAASLTLSTLQPGSHQISTMFTGSGVFADNASPPVFHQVSKGDTSTFLSSDHATTQYGQTIRFTINVAVQQPAAGVPSGIVTVVANDVAIGTAPVTGGVAIFDTSALHAGTSSISVAYSGDARFNASASASIQQTVAKARTAVDARLPGPIYIGASPVITVIVSASVNPIGDITTSEGSTVLDIRPLADGKASVPLAPQSLGDHFFVVSYGGNADFEPSSAVVTARVIQPALAVQGARVTEGDSGTTIVSLPVSLSAAVAVPVRVSFTTVAGSATEGSDYEKASGIVEFAPGEQTKSIELHILGDTQREPEETFSVIFFDPVNATLQSSTAVIVIDDRPGRRRAVEH